MKKLLVSLSLVTAFLLFSACSDGDRAGSVRLLVQEDGTVLLNGEPVALEALPARVEALAATGDTVWYHRVGARLDPHPNAMEVLMLLVESNVPVRLFMDAEFEHPEDGRH